MKYVKCIFSQKLIDSNPNYRITHNKIYEIYSYQNCIQDEFWIICDDMTKGRFNIDNNSSYKYSFKFEDATIEIRDQKINKILNA